MKRNIKMTIVSIAMCICMLLTSIIYANAESITITQNAMSYGRGYSWHYEYTNVNNVSGYSEANCIHRETDGEVYVFAYLRSSSFNGQTYSKELHIYTNEYAGTRTQQVYTTSASSIEWNQPVNFERGLVTDIVIEESAGLAADSWEAIYTYHWAYTGAIPGNTILSGTYVSD